MAGVICVRMESSGESLVEIARKGNGEIAGVG